MAGRRATVLTVMGILNIVFGSLFMLCNLCAAVGLMFLFSSSSLFALPGFNVGPDMLEFMKQEVPAYVPVTVSHVVLSLILDIVLLVSGIGLLNVQRWGRALALIYCVVSIPMQLGITVFTVAVVNPAMQRWQLDFFGRMGAQLPPGAMGGNSVTNNLMSLVVGILWVVYAVVLLIMMVVPSTRAAFAGGPPSREPFPDRPYDADDEDRHRTRRNEWDY
jgi:hypothetical protein